MKNEDSANFWAIKTQKMYYNMRVDEYRTLDLRLSQSPLIYLYGTLGMWKTTLSQEILATCTGLDSIFPSPTYTYYNMYRDNIYHFDLYRLESYDTFVLIGGEEILLNRTWCVIVEWPELIENIIEPDITIHIESGSCDMTRNLRIEFTPRYLS